MKSHFYVSSKETGITHLYVTDAEKNIKVKQEYDSSKDSKNKESYWELDPVQTKHYKKFVYFPKMFETMNRAEVEKFKKRFNWRFYNFYRTNKDLMLKEDRGYVRNRIISMYWSIFMSLGILGFANGFCSKITIPFYDYTTFSKVFKGKYVRA